MTRTGRPLRVLVSAYTCVPGKGSEPGAGWAWTLAAARSGHEVWLLTDRSCRPEIEAELAARPVPQLRPIFLETPDWVTWTSDSARGNRARYIRWQQLAAGEASRLHEQVGFDVAHHVTMAGDWLPIGVARLPDVPLVWGPVGGASAPTWQLWRDMGATGAASELARLMVTGAGRRVFGDRAAARSSLLIAQNPDVARRFRRAREVVIEPNVALDRSLLPARREPDGPPRTAVYAGRLLGWKGIWLAVDALSRPEAAGWTLSVYGDGPQLHELQVQAAALGIADRVEFLGTRPRPEVLEALAGADALLFPSLHDSAGWIVAEAVAIGCPVVCLDLAGPSHLVGPRDGVRVSPVGDVAGGLARALADLGPSTGPSTRFDAARLPRMLDGWYREVAGIAAPEIGPLADLEPMSLRPLSDVPLVSVLMANYNYARFLPKAVRSILEQTYSNLEVVIGDDCSSDDSVSVLSELAKSDDRVKILQMPSNGGQSATISAAFAACSGEVICLLDADDWYFPDKVAAVVEAFRTPDVGMVTHQLRAVDGDGVEGGVIPGRSRLREGWLAPEVAAVGGMLSGLPQTTALALRREVAEQIFPVPAATRYVDVYLQMLAPLLTRLGAIERPLATYRWHGGNSTWNYLSDAAGLEKFISARTLARAGQLELLARTGHEGALRPLDEDLFLSKLIYAKARLERTGELDVLLARVTSNPKFGEDMLADRLLWRASNRLPRRVFSAAVDLRYNPTSPLRRALVSGVRLRRRAVAQDVGVDVEQG